MAFLSEDLSGFEDELLAELEHYDVQSPSKYLGRYEPVDEHPADSTNSRKPLRATDNGAGQQPVRIKTLRNHAAFHREVSARAALRTVVQGRLIDIMRTHVPFGTTETMDQPWRQPPFSPAGEYVVVTQQPTQTLEEFLAKVGDTTSTFYMTSVRKIVHSVAHALQVLHSMGRIHGSLSTSTIVSHNGTWKLSDLDCSYQKGAVRDCTEARNCTNCTMAPELVAESLKEDPDGIQALVTQDIWGFGVVLFEMTAQQPLLWQRTSRRVAAWTEMPEDALSALHKGDGVVSRARQLVTKDLIARCLEGRPKDRPRSMEEVLSHAYFQEGDITLPQVLPHHNRLDVILAYRSGDEAMLRRIRRTLTELGITTADSSQIPAGQDWRQWYLTQLEDAMVFIPIVSSRFLKSRACFEEVSAAMRLHKANQLGIAPLMYERAGWDKARQPIAHPMDKEGGTPQGMVVLATADEDGGYISTYQELASTEESMVPRGGDFQDAFFDNIRELVHKRIAPCLKPYLDTCVHVVILCTDTAVSHDQHSWAQALQVTLSTCGSFSKKTFRVCCKEAEWDTPKKWNPRICIPILSAEFLRSPTCYRLMARAQDAGVQFLPVVHRWNEQNGLLWRISLAQLMSIIGKKKQGSPGASRNPLIPEEEPVTDAELRRRLPFLASILNCANCTNISSFDDNREVNTGKLVCALKELLQAPIAPMQILKNRVRKYRHAVLDTLPVPEAGAKFIVTNGEHLTALRRRILMQFARVKKVRRESWLKPEGDQEHSPTGDGGSGLEERCVILCHSGDKEEVHLAEQVKAALEAKCPGEAPIRVELLKEVADKEWFYLSTCAGVCVPLLSAKLFQSRYCESQLTFARDNGKGMVPVLVDTGFNKAMDIPTAVDLSQSLAETQKENERLQKELRIQEASACCTIS